MGIVVIKTSKYSTEENLWSVSINASSVISNGLRIDKLLSYRLIIKKHE
jgi:hypothetical protein